MRAAARGASVAAAAVAAEPCTRLCLRFGRNVASKKNAEFLSASGMKWMSSSAKRQRGQAPPLPRRRATPRASPRAASRRARRRHRACARARVRPRCHLASPLIHFYIRLTNILDTSISKTTMRPNPSAALGGSSAVGCPLSVGQGVARSRTARRRGCGSPPGLPRGCRARGWRRRAPSQEPVRATGRLGLGRIVALHHPLQPLCTTIYTVLL